MKSFGLEQIFKAIIYIYLVLLWQMLQTMGLGYIKVLFYNLDNALKWILIWNSWKFSLLETMQSCKLFKQQF